MGNVFLNLFNISITASWITLAVVILRLALKKAPKWITCALWAVVALRLVMPFSLESVFSLIPSTQTLAPPHSVSQTAPDIETGINFIDAPLNEYIDTNFVASAEETAERLSFDSVMDIVGVVWAVGVVVMLAYGFISYLRLKYKVRISIPCRENIYFCDRIGSPFILGIFRPRIYLPPDISKEETDYVILHEKAHLKRKDHLTKPFGFILMSVYWFNPIIWLAYVLLCRDIELACDEKAIKDMDGKFKKGYSEALLSLSVGRSVVAACPLAFGEISIKDRIKSIVNYKKPAFWTVVVAVVVCIVFAVCFLTNPKTDKEPQNSSSLSGSEQGDVSSLVTSETAQTETSSDLFSSSLSNSSLFSSQTMSATATEDDGLTPEYKQKARQTIEAVKQKNISTIRYYSGDEVREIATTQYRPFEKVKNSPTAKIETDKEKIKQIIKELRLDEWVPDICTLRGLPQASIYLDEDVYIDLEGQSGGNCWISINLGNLNGATFLAPRDVYSKLEDDCRVKIASAQLAERIVETMKGRKYSEIKFYDVRGKVKTSGYCPLEQLSSVEPTKTLTNSSEIESFRESLRLNEWKPYGKKTEQEPKFYIYFNGMQLSLEMQTEEVSVVSTNSESTTAYFSIPKDVYDSLEAMCSRQYSIATQLIKTVKEKDVSVLRYYDSTVTR